MHPSLVSQSRLSPLIRVSDMSAMKFVPASLRQREKHALVNQIHMTDSADSY